MELADRLLSMSGEGFTRASAGAPFSGAIAVGAHPQGEVRPAPSCVAFLGEALADPPPPAAFRRTGIPITLQESARVRFSRTTGVDAGTGAHLDGQPLDSSLM